MSSFNRSSSRVRYDSLEQFGRAFQAQQSHDKHVADQKLARARFLISERRRLVHKLADIDAEIQTMTLSTLEFSDMQEKKRCGLSQVEASDRPRSADTPTFEVGGRT